MKLRKVIDVYSTILVSVIICLAIALVFIPLQYISPYLLLIFQIAIVSLPIYLKKILKPQSAHNTH